MKAFFVVIFMLNGMPIETAVMDVKPMAECRAHAAKYRLAYNNQAVKDHGPLATAELRCAALPASRAAEFAKQILSN